MTIKKAIDMLFITQCKEYKRVLYHSGMKDGIHISYMRFCPFCGHKLDKEYGQLNDLTKA
jgi:hypothetical protein